MQALRKVLSTAFLAGFCCVAAAQSNVRIGEIPTAAPIPVRETVLPSVISDQFRAEGDSLRNVYDFNGAITSYINAMRNTSDPKRESDLEERMAWCEFAYGMTGACERPKVVGKQRFHRNDFFLYYPLPDKSWHHNSSRPTQPIYAPEDAQDIYFSSGERYFPMVCGDRLYFSTTKDGMGGYDIHVAHWNSSEGTWGKSENLGFPYNSPHNDYLYVDTPDGKYSVFASDRECPGTDSVYVYVLEQNLRPAKVSVDSAPELSELCTLAPSGDLKTVDNSVAISSMTRDESIGKEYSNRIAQVAALRDSLDKKTADASEEELAAMRARLEKASAELQKVEAEFLFSSSNTDFRKLAEETEKEVVVGIGKTFLFTRKAYGAPMNFLSVD